MNRKIIVISFEPLSQRLKSYIEKRYQKAVDCLNLPRRLFDNIPVHKIDEYNFYFQKISQYLDFLSPECLKNLVVFFTIRIEYYNFERWNSLLHFEEERERPHPPEILLSWLILSYPEVRWIFLGKTDKEDIIPISKYHLLSDALELAKIFSHKEYIPMFDPSGFRNKIRKVLLSPIDWEGRKIVSGIPQRQKVAATVDEEKSNAYLSAYTAYRFGYRIWAITSWEMMRSVFEINEEEIDLVFEELYLNFSDSTSNFNDSDNYKRYSEEFSSDEQRLSNLKFRDRLFPLLKNVQYRIIVTVGYKRTKNEKEKWDINQKYLKELRIKINVLLKPHSGIFDLWKKAWDFNSKKVMSKILNFAEEFEWPPSQQPIPEKKGAHSAPGRLLNIAEKLVDRAKKILKNAQSVPDAIQAAVLALEAKELLADRTPTTALQALSLQHQAEILAESMFYGTKYNLNVKDRFKEIEKEVKAISRWFNPDQKKFSELNTRLSIIEDLATKFRQLNRFDEELKCLKEARKLRFDFFLRRNFATRLLWPILKYADFSLRSLGHLVAVVGSWVILFTLIYFFCLSEPSSLSKLLEAFSSSTVFFFTLEPTMQWDQYNFLVSNNYWNLILAFQGLISFTSLSLLLSNLYMIVSRR